jgi:hypothetical protein
MMICRGIVCLLLGTLAWGQAAQPASSSPAASPNPPAASSAAGAGSSQAQPSQPAAPAQAAPTPTQPASTPPDAAVITIDGLCDNPPAEKSAASGCKTVITRAQLEEIINDIQPNMAPAARKQFATRYANALIMSQQAHKMKLDSGPRFDELMRLQRLTVLSQLLGQAVQEQAAQVPDKEIEDYYQKNSVAFEEVDIQRLFIPKSKSLETPKGVKLTAAETKKRTDDSEAAMKTEGEALRKRAVAGEDFAKLQDEAFQFAGLKAKAPVPNMGKVRRNALPPTQAAVMDLKTGEVSQVFTDQTGYFVYKAGARDTVPLPGVHDEIAGTLRTQRMQAAVQAIQQSATPSYDDAYFAVPGAPAPQGMTMPPGAPQVRPTLTGPK